RLADDLVAAQRVPVEALEGDSQPRHLLRRSESVLFAVVPVAGGVTVAVDEDGVLQRVGNRHSLDAAPRAGDVTVLVDEVEVPGLACEHSGGDLLERALRTRDRPLLAHDLRAPHKIHETFVPLDP